MQGIEKDVLKKFTNVQLTKCKIWEILQDLVSSINNSKKKIGGKLLKIKRNLKDSL